MLKKLSWYTFALQKYNIFLTYANVFVFLQKKDILTRRQGCLSEL